MARDVAGCIELLAGSTCPEVSAVGICRSRVAWGADVPRAGDADRRFRRAEAVEPAFMREVGDVHRELYAEQGELYGENVRTQDRGCIAVTDAEYEAAVRARAASSSSGRRRRSTGSTCS